MSQSPGVMNNYKIEIKWAFLFILMILVWMGLERLTGLHDVHIDKHSIYTNLVAIPSIAIYTLALLDKRKNFYSGFMTYKQGLLFGIIMTLVIAVLSPFSQIVVIKLITPDYFTNIIEYSVSSGKSTREVAESYFNLKNYIIQSLIGAVVMGFLTTAIVAIFTQKKGK